MSNSTERDDRVATQTLWDIYLQSGQRQAGVQGVGTQASRAGTKDSRQTQPASSPSVLSRPPGMGRIVTSGDFQNARPSSEGSDLLQRELQARGSSRTPRSQASERVTVIVQRPVSPKDEAQQPPPPEVSTVPVDFAVPPSAFASLRGAGNSARSSVDLAPVSVSAGGNKGADEERADGRGDPAAEPQIEARESGRPAKRQKMQRAVSLNTILQTVGCQEEDSLKDAAGTAPLTVEDIVASPKKATTQGAQVGEPLRLGASATRSNVSSPPGPFLPPRKSSEQSTIEIHKQIALRDSGNTVETPVREAEAGHSPSRALAAERDLHSPVKPGEGGVAERGQGDTDPMHAKPAAVKGEADAQRLVMWAGKVKHRLKTAEGTSVVELFNVSVMVPEELMEQMPPTLFVSTLAGRANVKLGKHFVAQCSLSTLDSKQRQKVTTLAVMRLVAICELQHCTLTLVPFTDSQHGLRMVGFMIADD